MKYIFERNPDTGDIFRREFGNYNKREKHIDKRTKK